MPVCSTAQLLNAQRGLWSIERYLGSKQHYFQTRENMLVVSDRYITAFVKVVKHICWGVRK